MFASHFPSDKVQDEAEVRGSIPVLANDWGKNTAAVAVLLKGALYWASLIFLRAMQLEVELLCAIVVLLVDSFFPFLQSGPRNSRWEDPITSSGIIMSVTMFEEPLQF